MANVITLHVKRSRLKTRFIFIFITSFVIAGSMLLDSCRKNEVKVSTTPLPLFVPSYFPQPVFDFQATPTSEEGFVLGRKLFYDGQLSKDGMFPCSSCHQQIAAFTTFEHDRSHGYNSSHTLRNAPALANLAWYPYFNWDGSAPNLAAVYKAHITDPHEMGESMQSVVNKLSADTSYHRLFADAFGSTLVNAERIFNALTQFVIHLVSYNSKYDRVKRNEASFTAEEQNGYVLFQQKCGSCHKEPLFTDFSFRNIGLEVDHHLIDLGRMRVTRDRNDSLKFRVPSLRNVELTSYYTHDGRLSFMRMMLLHYRNGVNQSATLDPALVNGIQLSLQQENEIIAFLRTLSDSSYLSNPRFHE